MVPAGSMWSHRPGTPPMLVPNPHHLQPNVEIHLLNRNPSTRNSISTSRACLQPNATCIGVTSHHWMSRGGHLQPIACRSSTRSSYRLSAQVIEYRTQWGAALSAPLISMTCALAFAAGGLIPIDCAIYDTVWRYLMPLAAACFLLETDVHRQEPEAPQALSTQPIYPPTHAPVSPHFTAHLKSCDVARTSYIITIRKIYPTDTPLAFSTHKLAASPTASAA